MYKSKILVVDDVQANIDALVTILEELDTETEIITCNNGNDAVIEAMKNDFALMLLDVQMPGMDGFETLEYIRKEEKNKVVPALFLSAVYTSEVFQQKGVSSGAIDFIIKPINPEILLGKVKLFLEINNYKYKLVKRQSLINATLEATAEGIMVIDSKNRVVRANKNFIEMWKLEVKENLSSESSYIKAFMLERVKNPDVIKRLIETDKEDFTGNLSNKIIELKNGNIFKLCVKPQKVFDEITGFVFSFVDITAQKQLEKNLEKNNMELAATNAKLEETTFNTVLLNKKLATSENELIKLNANKDRFFSIISHDLKSPFSSILVLSEMLAEEFDELDNETKKEWVGAIKNQAKNIYDLLEKILEWAQTQTGRIEFNPEKFDLYNLVDDLFDLFAPNADRKEIILKNEIKENLLLFGDVNMNMTVLRNFISNAIKFTPKGGEIKIWTEETETEYKVSVSDSGVGMDDKTLNNLFKIEVHNTSLGTEDERGTGVGLILCDEFVKKHNGKIIVTSEISKGSVFTYTIPKKIEIPVSNSVS